MIETWGDPKLAGGPGSPGPAVRVGSGQFAGDLRERGLVRNKFLVGNAALFLRGMR
jgi:hypothetical protein